MPSPRSASLLQKSVPLSQKPRSQTRQAESRSAGDPTQSPEYQVLQQRIADAVTRQHKLCAAKQACETELSRLMRSRRHDEHNKELAQRYDGKLQEMRALASQAENAAAEVGRFSGDLLMLRLRGNRQSAKRPQ